MFPCINLADLKISIGGQSSWQNTNCWWQTGWTRWHEEPSVNKLRLGGPKPVRTACSCFILTVLSDPACSRPAKKPCAYFSRLIHQLFCPCLLLLPPVYLILIAKQGQTQQWTRIIHFLNKWRENVNYFSLLSKEKKKPLFLGKEGHF